MFMIEANEAVAELFTKLSLPHLRRVHPEPPNDAQRKLTSFLRVLGRPIPNRLERDDMVRLLSSVRGTSESFAVNLAVLRSMAQAEYSPKIIGHFALASSHYAHFTSPIRRYPDLIVHRLLELHLTGLLKRRADKAAAPSNQVLAEIGAHCSYTERHAESAERELKLVKTLRFLEQHVGDHEPGVVTGVTNVGVFVQLCKYLVDGLIRFADLPDDWWDVNARAGCVVGQRSGTRIGIGDAVEVQIAGVDLAARELDLLLLSRSKTRNGKTTRSKPRKTTAKKRSTRTPRANPPRKGRRPRRH
jgi:ribonuclease R